MRKTSRDPLGIQSDAVGHQFLHFLAPLLASRDPVGIQSGTNFRVFGTTFGPVGKQLKSSKNVPKPYKNAVFMNLAAFRHWCPTGSRLDPDWPKAAPKKCKISAQLRPDSIPTASMDRQKPHLRPYFPLPRPPFAPILLFRAPAVHQSPPPSCTKNGKSCLKPNGGQGFYHIYLSIDLSIYLSVCLSVCIHTYVISLVTYPRSCVCVQMSSLASANHHANE